MFAAHGLRLFDVEELPTHGGSLRIFGCHEDDPRPEEERARALAARERAAGYESLETYTSFGERVVRDKREILKLLTELKDQGARIAGYGAPAKGNTLLNYCGIRPRLPRLHRRHEPAQAGPRCCPERTSRSARPRICSRTAPTSC